MILRTILAMAALAALATLAPASSAAASAQRPGCRPIAGLEQLWATTSLRWIVVGEQHGSWEMPAAFRDIVCNAASAKRPIVVAVERPEGEQRAIDAFLRSDGSEMARTALTGSRMWQSKELQDGRSSGAYLHLLDQLRVMYHEGAIRNVVAFQPDMPNFDPVAYEAEMAKRLRSASPTVETLVLAFVGNCHAMKVAMCGNKPAAAYLPSGETFTINVEGTGGSIWNCAPVCGARKVAGMSPGGTTRLEKLNDDKAPYDAMLFLQGPISASPPAVAQMEAAPPT